jgi:hypothetical protein
MELLDMATNLPPNTIELIAGFAAMPTIAKRRDGSHVYEVYRCGVGGWRLQLVCRGWREALQTLPRLLDLDGYASQYLSV